MIKNKISATCGVRHVAAIYDWRHPNRTLVMQDSKDRREATFFRAHAAPHGICDHLVNAVKLLANQQQGCDNLVEMLVGGLQERSRLKMIEVLRKFISVDNHEAVEIGDLEKTQESRLVLKPKFTTDFAEVVVREGADELTVRREDEGMLRSVIDTTNVGDSRVGPLLVDEDWRAVCQSTKASRDRDGRTCATSTWRCTNRSTSKKPGVNKKARTLCLMRDVSRKWRRLLRPKS